MRTRDLLTTVLLTFLAAPAARAATTFLVAAPASTPAGDTVFIAGDFQGWNPGSPPHALTRQPDGRWAITLALAPGVPIQFKFTRGDWARVEKGPNGEEIANRTLTPSGDATVPLTVARWADQGTLTGHVETFATPGFLAGRRCWIYLPPDYATSTRRYPVLYMHDGQNLFDVRTSFAGEWKVDEAAEELIGAGELAPFMVVGIENGPARITEYTPWADPGLGAGGGGGAYLLAIRDVLIPAINAAYRTLPGPHDTWMAGSSLGGLISAYAGFEHDDVWGRVAAVSPSYWWADRQMLAHAAAQGRPALERFYQDIGTAEGASAVQDVADMRTILLAQGFTEGVDLQSVVAPGQGHNESAWALRVPDMLRFITHPADVTAVGNPGGRPAIELRAGPSPAKTGVAVELTLERAAAVRAEVFDLRGARVRALSDGALPAGRHVLRWDLRDDAGMRVPAGLHWIRASAPRAVVTRPVVVLM